MKCPHCHEEIPGITCPECGFVTPEGARYCMECGTLLELGEGASSEGQEEFDLENRVLCPDGTCTGIIINGKCTVCEQIVEEGEEGSEKP